MAVQTALYSPRQREKAQDLVARSDRWAHGYRQSDGLQFVVFSSQSTPGAVYQTHIDGLGCTCPAGQRGVPCYHCLAAAMVTERAREQAVRPKTRYEDLFPADGLDEVF